MQAKWFAYSVLRYDNQALFASDSMLFRSIPAFFCGKSDVLSRKAGDLGCFVQTSTLVFACLNQWYLLLKLLVFV